MPGVYNVAGDGILPWSEVCAIVGKRTRPAAAVRSPASAAEPLRLLGIVDLPPEVLDAAALRPRVDNRGSSSAGFQYQYTTAGTVEAFAQGLRLAATVGDKHPTYQYERDVENFFRHSPAVVRPERG